MNPAPKKTQKNNDIAVIGMAGRFPGAPNIDRYWENLANGVESITFFSDEELEASGIPAQLLEDPRYIKAKGYLADCDLFDGDFFAYPPKQAERMDPQIRILHELSWTALEHAGYNPEGYPGRVGAYFGALDNLEWIRSLEGRPDEDMDMFLLSFRDYLSTRISYKLNLRGPSVTMLSACSTSLVSIHLACQALRMRECEAAIAGGVSIAYPHKSGYLYHEGLLLSSDGHCRTFDAQADGTVFGDGAGVVVLKTLEDALRDGDPIHAVVKGSAVNNDGCDRIGFTAPSIEGQRQVIEAALAAAAVRADTIQMVEAHGTGTKLGDPIEFEALRQAYKSKKKGTIALGSVKTNIGHTNIAAGVAAFIKGVLSLKNKQMPPSLNFNSPNPAINFPESPFFVNTRLAPWPKKRSPRRLGVSAFGFGGTNAHLILEEAPPSPPDSPITGEQLIVLSAKTPAALDRARKNLAEYLSENPDLPLSRVARTLALGRKAFNSRQTWVAGTMAQTIQALSAEASYPRTALKTAETVFMFPGQGAQYPNMARDLYRGEPVFREEFDRCAEILYSLLGVDIRQLIFLDTPVPPDDTSAQLSRTSLAQPAIFCVSHSLAELLKSWGIHPSACMGHSLGEFVAACQAGVFSLEDALLLVSRRGELMQAVAPGAMLAVPLSEEELGSWMDSRLALAAVNTPDLCVVSGDQDAINDLRQRLRTARIASQPLATSHAFHSPMMEPALEPFRKLARGIEMSPPALPIMSTVTGSWVSPEEICTIEYWVKNLRQTVRFSQAVNALSKSSEAALLEVGPGNALSSLCRMQMSRTRLVLPTMRGPKDLRSDRAVILDSIGKLWAAGLTVKLHSLFNEDKPQRLPLPGYPFEGNRYRSPRSQRAKPSPSWMHLTKTSQIADWFSVPSWKRANPIRLDLSEAPVHMTWLLFMDDQGLAERLASRLEHFSQMVIRVEKGDRYSRLSDRLFCLRPGEKEDYEALFLALQERDMSPRHILHLWSITDPELHDIPLEQAEKMQTQTFFSLLFLAQVVGNLNLSQEMRISVITNHCLDVSGSDPVIPDKATMLGPLKVVPQEFPTIDTCFVDVSLPTERSGADLEDHILTEIVTNQAEPVVAYRGDFRWVQRYEPLHLGALPQSRSWLKQNGCYLITGGLGGLGLVLASHLAETVGGRLILTGRSPLPPRDDWAAYLNRHGEADSGSQRIRKIEKLEALGGSVIYIQADVADMGAMKAGLAAAERQFGPVNGVIHAAGLPGEGVISLKSVEEAGRVLSPKLLGTRVLSQILTGHTLDFMVLCSSIASVLGGIGLVDYCAANAYLDAFATAKHPYPVLGINWDMWGEVGMGLTTQMPQELKSWLERELRDGITNREGIEAFNRILCHGRSSNTIVSTRSLPARIDMWIRRELIKQKTTLVEEENTEPVYQRPELASAFIPPQGDTEIRVAAIWSRLFGIAELGRLDNFYELGGHSLLATTVVSKLKREFDAAITIRDIQDHPTVAGIAALIDKGVSHS